MWCPKIMIVLLAVCGAPADAHSEPDGTANSRNTPADSTVHYTRKQLRALVRSARTAEDHERLAVYFRARAFEFSTRAAEQEHEFTEYIRNPGGYPSKYPTRGDAAKGLAAYYRIKATQANSLASEHAHQAEQIRTAR
jgi:hypothetical protein